MVISPHKRVRRIFISHETQKYWFVGLRPTTTTKILFNLTSRFFFFFPERVWDESRLTTHRYRFRSTYKFRLKPGYQRIWRFYRDDIPTLAAYVGKRVSRQRRKTNVIMAFFNTNNPTAGKAMLGFTDSISPVNLLYNWKYIV